MAHPQKSLGHSCEQFLVAWEPMLGPLSLRGLKTRVVFALVFSVEAIVENLYRKLNAIGAGDDDT